LLTTAVEPADLVPYLIGPHPTPSTALVLACLETPRAETLRARLESAAGGADNLLAMDSALLSGLYLAGAWHPTTPQDRGSVGQALRAVGRLREAWPLLPREPALAIEDPTPLERLAQAWQHYEDAAALERYLHPLLDDAADVALRREALERCVLASIVRGDERSDRTQQHIRRLLSSPGLEPESLRDDPALWRLLETSK
jgi:hypothetical protein